jgi:hypothetical protein
MRDAQFSVCLEGIGIVCCMMTQAGSPQKPDMGLECLTSWIAACDD